MIVARFIRRFAKRVLALGFSEEVGESILNTAAKGVGGGRRSSGGNGCIKTAKAT